MFVGTKHQIGWAAAVLMSVALSAGVLHGAALPPGAGGGGNNTRVAINTGTSPVINGMLGQWDTTGLPNCPHVRRLVVSDTAALNGNGAIHHNSVFLVSVNVGGDAETGQSDLNGDDLINVFDLLILPGAWGACP